MTGWLLATLQRPLPQHAISRLTGRIAASTWRPLKNLLIRLVVKLYGVNLQEAAHTDPDDYPSFNAFFTRALAPGARRIDDRAGSIVSPVDGIVSQYGPVADGQLIQAKGHRFSVSALLGRANHDFDGGRFITIYLSPRHYHRVHTPAAGRLHRLSYIPGRLFSVGAATTRIVDGVYARNERVVFDFATGQTGAMALVMVGALNVGSIATVNHGVVAPGDSPKQWQYDPAIDFARGDELARFNLGSTVILLFAPGRIELHDDLACEAELKLGQTIAIQSESR